MSHFKDVCQEHGIVVKQCRCMGPKVDRIVPHGPLCDTMQELAKQIEVRRTDRQFMDRLSSSIKQNRDILDALAPTDGPMTPEECEASQDIQPKDGGD